MTSFYDAAPQPERAEHLFDAYLDFLSARNGAGTSFDKREQRMADVFDNSPVRANMHVDKDRFNRNYGSFKERDISIEETALLSFVKINAGEAYGVEVTTAARSHLWELPESKYKVEEVVGQEETYHTRLLVGATQHFDDLQVGDAWRPAWPLRVLIGAMVRVPESMFHPIVLGAELSGVHTFNWLLHRLSDLFPDDPQVRESMEERLIEILIDEVGHVAFNRILVGDSGRKWSARIARQVSEGQRVMNKELIALGFNSDAIKGVETFDYDQLPQEVKDNSFFC